MKKKIKKLYKALGDLVSEIEMSGCEMYMNEDSAFKKAFNRKLNRARKLLAEGPEVSK